MSPSDTSPGFRPFEAQRNSNWLSSLGSSPFIWGTALTVVFYALIPVLPVDQQIAKRYFCAHWILYTETWLFAIGIAILAGKACRLPTERKALAVELLPGAGLRTGLDRTRKLTLLEQAVATLPRRIRQSELVRRYCDVGDYLSARHTADGLEDHLKYLHDVAGERLHDSYALSRTIIWAIPILGFLGTVIGITLAIANITPDQLEASMSEITSGLAVAFDTTALSLSLSMILVFGAFVVERQEQTILGHVESCGMRLLVPYFSEPHSAGNGSPLLQAEHTAAANLLEQTEKMINWQTQLWQQSLDGMRARWEEVANQQQAELSRTLTTGMQLSLGQHETQLATARNELSNTFLQLSTELLEAVSGIQRRSEEHQLAVNQQVATLWHDVQNEIHQLRVSQESQVDRLLQTVSEEASTWQSSLKEATHAGLSQVQELHSQGETLLKIVGEEAELSRLQKTLSDNLDTLHATETFEKALHSLTAAVHMMTVKNRAA